MLKSYYAFNIVEEWVTDFMDRLEDFKTILVQF